VYFSGVQVDLHLSSFFSFFIAHLLRLCFSKVLYDVNLADFSAQPAASLAWMATVPVMCTATQSSRVRAEIVSLQAGVSFAPTAAPTLSPSASPSSLSPVVNPTLSPTKNPTATSPTLAPARKPTLSPTTFKGRRSLQESPMSSPTRQAMRVFFRITYTQEDFNSFSAASLNRTIDFLKANFTANTQSTAFQTSLRSEMSERRVTGSFATTITPVTPVFDAGHSVVRTSYSPTCRPTAVPSTGRSTTTLRLTVSRVLIRQYYLSFSLHL